MEWNSVDVTDEAQDKFMGLSFRKKRRLKKREKHNTKRKKLYERIKDNILKERNNNVDYYFLEDIVI
jgi:hypothetical protein